MSDNTIIPAGEIRIVHPVLLCRAREGWEELEESEGLDIMVTDAILPDARNVHGPG